jgi:haloalkane dehalogenase
MMETLRTPDERFENLPGYDFAPHYTQVPDGEGGELRIHHIEEGPADGEPILLMHGQPSWSFLYRKMIPILVESGYRVFAPDLVGFGRSDKPTRRSDYTYARHVQWMSDWLSTNNLNGITLFCQDWGGLIGLRLVAAFPDRFARVVAANTALPYASPITEEMAPSVRKIYESLPVVAHGELTERFAQKDGPPGFLYWRKFCAETKELPIGEIVGGLGTIPTPSEVRSAYEAPFPHASYRTGAHIFPSLVPMFPDDPELPANRAAWKALAQFDKPFLTAFSDSDPVTAGGEAVFQKRIPGAKNQSHVTIPNAGHFLQEDNGAECAATMIAFIHNNPA